MSAIYIHVLCITYSYTYNTVKMNWIRAIKDDIVVVAIFRYRNHQKALSNDNNCIIHIERTTKLMK